MKSSLLTLGLLSVLSSLAMAAPTGQYVCANAGVDWDNGNVLPSSIARALNSLNCDSTKPISSTPIASTDGAVYNVVVCCSHK